MCRSRTAGEEGTEREGEGGERVGEGEGEVEEEEGVEAVEDCFCFFLVF